MMAGERAGKAYLSNGYRLLFHSLVNGNTIIFSHLGGKGREREGGGRKRE